MGEQESDSKLRAGNKEETNLRRFRRFTPNTGGGRHIQRASTKNAELS